MRIVGFAGRIASGKTAVSQRVAAELQEAWVGFGDAVRAEARSRGLDPTRTQLQELGDELIGQGWDAFCERVVRQADVVSGTLLVDGVRHFGAVEALSRIAGPDATVLVFVDAPWRVRAARLAARGVDADDARGADEHSNEAEVGALMGRADTLVVNDGHLEDAVSAALDALRAMGIRSGAA